MTADPDEDAALSWAGDEPATAKPTVVVETAAAEAKPATPSMLLITYGVLAGIFLLYTLGWVISVLRNTTTLPNLFGEIMFQLGEFLAIASPLLWFAGVFVLTRGRKPIVRLLWLLLGLVAVIPWPFVLGV